MSYRLSADTGYFDLYLLCYSKGSGEVHGLMTSLSNEARIDLLHGHNVAPLEEETKPVSGNEPRISKGTRLPRDSDPSNDSERARRL